MIHTGPKLFWISLITLLLAGCATSRVEWDARIGHYTYDQAVTEYGPPDKMARLTDGKLVAEWITRYNTGTTVFVGSGFRGNSGYIQTIGPNNYMDILRLTFDAHYVLYAWTKK